MGWGDVLKLVGVGAAPFTGGASLALTGLGAAGGVLGGAAKGAATERGTQNTFAQNQDRTKSANYGTQQGSLLNALLASGRDKLERYGTQQGATTQAMQGLQSATSGALANESNEKIQLAKLGMDAPLANAKASILGSLMKNMQPHQFASPALQRGHLTKVGGGLSPSALDPLTRQQGELMLQGALEKQLSGGGMPGATDFMGGIQDWKSSILNTPEATDYSKGLLLPPELAEYQKAGKGESIMSGLSTALGLAGALGGAFGEDGAGDGGGGRQFANQGAGAAPTAYGFRLPRYDFGGDLADYDDALEE